MKIKKSRLWYASMDRREKPLHICAEIKWSSSMELEKSAFKEQREEEGETDLLLYTLFLHNALIGWSSSQQSLWDFAAGGLAVASTIATCAVHIEQWSSSPPVGSSDQFTQTGCERRAIPILRVKALAWAQLKLHHKTEADGWLELPACSGACVSRFIKTYRYLFC